MSTACAHFCACDSSAELSRNEHGTLIADGSGQPPPCSRGLQAVEHTILPVRVISATPIGSRRCYRAAARCSVPHWLRQVACHPPKNSNLRDHGCFHSKCVILATICGERLWYATEGVGIAFLI